jgi:hypothetical protein
MRSSAFKLSETYEDFDYSIKQASRFARTRLKDTGCLGCAAGDSYRSGSAVGIDDQTCREMNFALSLRRIEYQLMSSCTGGNVYLRKVRLIELKDSGVNGSHGLLTIFPTLS